MAKRGANRESQDAADRGRERHPGPYESAEDAVERMEESAGAPEPPPAPRGPSDIALGYAAEQEARRRESRAASGDTSAESVDPGQELRAPEERPGARQASPEPPPRGDTAGH